MGEAKKGRKASYEHTPAAIDAIAALKSRDGINATQAVNRGVVMLNDLLLAEARGGTIKIEFEDQKEVTILYKIL